MAFNQKFYVKMIKNTKVNGVHYFPFTVIEKKSGIDYDSQPFIYKEGCQKVEVSEADFELLIATSRAVTACEKDVFYNEKGMPTSNGGEKFTEIKDKKKA